MVKSIYLIIGSTVIIVYLLIILHISVLVGLGFFLVNTSLLNIVMFGSSFVYVVDTSLYKFWGLSCIFFVFGFIHFSG
jgi:hypothetical protein